MAAIIFCISFCIHSAASSYWGVLGLLGLARRQYKVYDKKISPTNKETRLHTVDTP